MNLQDIGALIGQPVEEEDVFAPMAQPTHVPQMEADDGGDSIKPIRDLFDETPFFSEEFIPELEHHCRSSVAVRSAIRLSLEIARKNMIALRHAEDMTATARHQGAINGLEEFHETLITMIENPPEPADLEEDIEDESE